MRQSHKETLTTICFSPFSFLSSHMNDHMAWAREMTHFLVTVVSLLILAEVKMAEKCYKQEMPPPGGYSDIHWAKKTPPKKIGGEIMYSWAWFDQVLKKCFEICLCTYIFTATVERADPLTDSVKLSFTISCCHKVWQCRCARFFAKLVLWHAYGISVS